MRDTMKFKGKYIIEAVDVRTGKIVHSSKHNVVVQGFFTGVFKFLDQAVSSPSVDDLNVTHIAVGDGTASAMRSDTLLDNEVFRKVTATKSFTTTTFTCKMALGPTEGNPSGGFIKEVAVFAKATDTVDTGTMISRANVNVAKNNNIKLTITWVLTGA